MQNANFPMSADGRTYHVGTREGEVANRILTVGDHERALRIAKHLTSTQTLASKRGFLTITGYYNDTRGYSLMDMMVREVRAVTHGPLLIARFGSCGGIGMQESIAVGNVCVATEGVIVTRNHNYFITKTGEAYPVSLPVAADSKFTQHVHFLMQLLAKLSDCLGDKVTTGRNASADSFYSSQGRIDSSFGDENHDLTNKLVATGCSTLEMESSMLFHLAKNCTEQSKVEPGHRGPIVAGACAMIFADRKSGAFIQHDVVENLEFNAGKAVLDALCTFEMPL